MPRVSVVMPVFAQAAIVAHLLFLLLRSLGRRGPGPLLAVCFVLAAVTSLPWTVSELMADVFTGVVVLALWLLGFGAVTHILWELAEYLTFIRGGPEEDTAYTDTLGDLTLSLSGSVVGALIVARLAPAPADRRRRESGVI